MSDKIRTFIISDIHACLEEFEELLKLISYNPNKHNVILLGDLLDRGYNSEGVVKKCRELNLRSVMGNHEYKYLNNKNRNFIYDFSDDDIKYLESFPYYIRLNNDINNYIIVHAGLKPNIKLEDQDLKDLITIRYFDKNNNPVSLTQLSKLCNHLFGLDLSVKDNKFFDKLNNFLLTRKQELGIKFWTEFWTGPENIVYGHSVHSTKHPLIEKISEKVSCYGLDTGCVFGGNLTGLCLETKEIVQVKSKYIYSF